MNALHTAEALSSGHGRQRKVSLSDETFNVVYLVRSYSNATRGNNDLTVQVSND